MIFFWKPLQSMRSYNSIIHICEYTRISSSTTFKFRVVFNFIKMHAANHLSKPTRLPAKNQLLNQNNNTKPL